MILHYPTNMSILQILNNLKKFKWDLELRTDLSKLSAEELAALGTLMQTKPRITFHEVKLAKYKMIAS